MKRVLGVLLVGVGILAMGETFTYTPPRDFTGQTWVRTRTNSPSPVVWDVPVTVKPNYVTISGQFTDPNGVPLQGPVVMQVRGVIGDPNDPNAPPYNLDIYLDENYNTIKVVPIPPTTRNDVVGYPSNLIVDPNS